MSAIRRLTACIILILAGGGCGDESSGPGPENFTATFTSGDVTTGAGRCPDQTVFINGPGTSTPGGSLTTELSHCTSSQNPLPFTDGAFIFTYSGGDEVSGTYSGALIPTADLTVFDVDGEFTITDGTGAFADATGSGSITGSLDIASGDASITLDGTLER
jgi:hypothetical protein